MIVASAALRPSSLQPILAPAAAAPSLHALFQRQPVETVEPGAAIAWEGDPADHVFAIESGVMRAFRVLPDGRRVIVAFLYPGDLVGVAATGLHACTVEAVNAVRLRRLGRNRFREAVEASPPLWSQYTTLLCAEMAAAQDHAVVLARKSAEERVCNLLLKLARRADEICGNACVIDLPISRLDMADHLGLTIETVSRTMTNLAGRGIVAANGRHTLAIRRLAMLANLAGEDAGADNRGSTSRAARQAARPH